MTQPGQEKSEENEEVLKDYFWIHKLILGFCGVSLRKQDSALYKIYSRFIFCLVTFLTFEEIYTALKIFNDLTKVADLFSICISHILGFVKLNVLLKNRILIIETLDTLHTGVFFPNTKRGGKLEAKLIKSCVRTGYLQMFIYYGPLVVTMANAFSRAMITQLHEDNHELWEFPWEGDKDNLHGSEKYKEFLEERLRSAAFYHQEIIQLTERFEYLFNLLVLAVYIGDGIVICFAMYLSTVATFGLSKIISEITYLLGIIVQLGLYCYYGNELTLASDTISFACYNANFVGTTISFQKGLLQIMMRSQRPIILTAGKFANLCLSAFVTVMRASYSYFMVMKGGVRS
ncbi:hypothetical protein Trydic_g18996 [Trypoxylus dichotomus]